VVICSQLPDNDNTYVTNLAEYLAAEIIREHCLSTPMVWVEHYPEHEGEIGGVLPGEVRSIRGQTLWLRKHASAFRT
jgi:hypothetical protein